MEIRSEKPGYAALRRFRESRPGAEYFLTVNLKDRGRGVEEQELTAQVFQQWQGLEREGLWSVRTAVVMPDHIHLLVCLGAAGSLIECMRLMKGRLTPALRKHGLKWQEGFYEHQVRAAEDRLPIFLYIFLNPYRGNLISAEQSWLGYFCHPEDWDWFGDLTRESVPQPEWLR